MGNALTTLNKAEAIQVLQTSLYPGARKESVEMVLAYCQLRGLDVMLKPVHIVPMWDNKAGENRDVILPGINLYRVMAEQSGQHVGTSEPEFGPDITEDLGGVRITYPEWCRVVVKKALPSGAIAEYVAKEYWKENYAKKGGKERSIAPNSMWQTRVRGQLAKCAESQALRRAFPSMSLSVGEYTAEEMEGKVLNEDGSIQTKSSAPATLPFYSREDFEKNLPAWKNSVLSGKNTPQSILSKITTKYTLHDDQVAAINDLAVTDVTPKSNIDSETGEVKFTYAEIAHALQSAKSVDDVDQAADMINVLDKPEQAQELRDKAATRRLAFE